jgi:hypothetical protein
MRQRERREGMFDLSDDMVAGMEDDGWELVAVVPHIGRQHPGQTEYVFEREAYPGKPPGPRRMDLFRGVTTPDNPGWPHVTAGRQRSGERGAGRSGAPRGP